MLKANGHEYLISNLFNTGVSNIMTNNVDIRYAKYSDCKSLSNLIAVVIQNIPYYNQLAKETEIKKFQPFNLQQKIKEDRYSVIIALINNDIIGFCLSRFDDFVIWLEWFGVHETQRGKGVAHLLLEQVDKTVSVRNCHKIWCDCRTTNNASVYMLTSHGYKQLVTIKNHWYKQDFILWEKIIAS